MAQAAMKKYKYVTYLPSYAAATRGGPCEATVVISDKRVASPLLFQAQTVVLMELSQRKDYVPRVAPGGLLIVEKGALKDGMIAPNGFTIFPVPGMEIAFRTVGGAQGANLVHLGAYIGYTKALPTELIEDELKRRYGSKQEILAKNTTAFKQGLEVGLAFKG